MRTYRAGVARAITFLSDYGLGDEWVGTCHAVIASICPEARVIDLAHGIGRHDVQAGAVVLADAVPYLPVGIHLAVVDPEVGAERRAVAARTRDDRVFVGPDNGLLWPALARLGGAAEVVELGRSPFRLEPVSATFHGRDLFAPVAARLAAGASLGEAGDPLSTSELVALELPRPRRVDGALVADVLALDAFGNVQLAATHDDLPGTGLRLGRPLCANGEPCVFARTFADAPDGALLLYEDAARRLALAVNRGSAVGRLGLERGSEVRLEPA
jgi:S-adenosylmethionine hydrolase